MTAPLSRRAVLGAAWSAPVIALAVAVPESAASTVPDEHLAVCVSNSGSPSRLFEYLAVSDSVITVKLRRMAQDWFDINVQMPAGHNFHLDQSEVVHQTQSFGKCV